jgi:hypothetical protein
MLISLVKRALQFLLEINLVMIKTKYDCEGVLETPCFYPVCLSTIF